VTVELLAIAFNHDTDSATADAINLRENNNRFLAVPEWRRGISQQRSDSVACYALELTAGQALTIAAQFARRDATVESAEVRAIGDPVRPPPPVPMLYPYLFSAWEVLYAYQWYYALLAQLSSAAVLGDLESREITFQPNGESTFEQLSIRDVTLQERGVGAHPVDWRWQYRLHAQAPWTDFAVSRHLIYSIIGLPTAPWVQQPYLPTNTQLPWIEVLDFACRWAAGAQSRDEAATRITRAIYDAGGERIEYDCTGPAAVQLGTPHYTLIPGLFECTEFLERLRGGLGNGRYVNCSDCASAVATFANVLGCDLWQSRMFGGVPFSLNPTRAIGSSTWLSACAVGAYNMHEVAWKGDCTDQDEVFDASLQVDGDADPTRGPHTPLLVANLRFGRTGEGQYRDRLASPAGRWLCEPQPHTRQRRFVI
jgi:hypothetical protein